MQEKKVCNVCGRELDFFDLQQGIFDGDIVDMQLCCDCFDDLVNECKVSPIIEVSDDDE